MARPYKSKSFLRRRGHNTIWHNKTRHKLSSISLVNFLKLSTCFFTNFCSGFFEEFLVHNYYFPELLVWIFFRNFLSRFFLRMFVWILFQSFFLDFVPKFLVRIFWGIFGPDFFLEFGPDFLRNFPEFLVWIFFRNIHFLNKNIIF